MALTIELTKISVQEAMPKMFNITVNMRCLDGIEEVINQDFTEDHRIGNTIDYTINKFKMKMQKAIDMYKSEQQIFTSVLLDDAISTLQSQLVG